MKEAYDILHKEESRAAYDDYLRGKEQVQQWQSKQKEEQNAFGDKLERQ